jgi:hypothetical protein
MNRALKYFSMSLLISLISLFMTIPVMAIPTLPSSFYGTIKVNGENVPDGTLVQALINDQVAAQVTSQTYQTDSVYALDIPGDDSDTVVQDGGRENDPIKFKIGGALAEQTGTWKGATNVNLNLSATVVGGIVPQQSTASPIPTQTAIVLIQRSPTPTQTPGAQIQTSSISTQTPVALLQPSPITSQTSIGIIQSSSTPIPSAQPTLKATPLIEPSVISSSLNQSSPTSISPMGSGDGSSNTESVVTVVLIVIGVVGIAIFALRSRLFGVRKSRGTK